jgi:hypothetical protein
MIKNDTKTLGRETPYRFSTLHSHEQMRCVEPENGVHRGRGAKQTREVKKV